MRCLCTVKRLRQRVVVHVVAKLIHVDSTAVRLHLLQPRRLRWLRLRRRRRQRQQRLLHDLLLLRSLVLILALDDAPAYRRVARLRLRLLGRACRPTSDHRERRGGITPQPGLLLQSATCNLSGAGILEVFILGDRVAGRPGRPSGGRLASCVLGTLQPLFRLQPRSLGVYCHHIVVGDWPARSVTIARTAIAPVAQ